MTRNSLICETVTITTFVKKVHLPHNLLNIVCERRESTASPGPGSQFSLLSHSAFHCSISHLRRKAQTKTRVPAAAAAREGIEASVTG